MNVFSQEDWNRNKLAAGLGYIVFFLPLILCKESKLGRYCANQGLLLTIVCVLVSLFLGIFTGIPLLGWIFTLAQNLVRFALLLVGVLCFVMLTTQEKLLELPIVGKLRIIQ